MIVRIPRYLPRAIGIIMLGFPIIFGYQNCSKKAHFSSLPSSLEVQPLAIPFVLITSEPVNLGRAQSVSVSFSINADHPEAVDRYECFLNEVEIQECQSPLNIDNLEDGSYIFKVKVIDVQGVQSEFNQADFAIDQTNPLVVINSRPMDISSSTTANYTFSVSDNFIGIETVTCSLNDGTDEVCSDTYTVSSLSDGQYSLKIKATDKAGNYVEAVDQFIVDSTAPQIQIVNKPNSFTNSNQAAFTYVGTDQNGISEYQCSLNGSNFSTCVSNGINYGSLAEGVHTFSVRAIDGGGLTSAPVSYSWIVDRTVPTNIVSTTNMPYPRFLIERSGPNNITFNYSSTDSGSGIDRYTYSINGGTEQPCAVPCDVNITAEGRYGFIFYAYDKAGNKTSLQYQPLVAKFVTDLNPVATVSSIRTGISFQAKPYQILQKDSNYLITGGSILNITNRANPSFINFDKTHRFFAVQANLFFGLEGSSSAQLSVINLTDPASPKIISSNALITLRGSTQTIQSLSADGSSLYVCYSTAVVNPSNGSTTYDAVVSAFDVSNPGTPALRYHHNLESGLLSAPTCYGNKSKLVVVINGASKKIKFYEASASGASNLTATQTGIRTDGIVMSNDLLFVNSGAAQLREVYSLNDLNQNPLSSLGRTYGFTNGHSTGALASGGYTYSYGNRNFKFVDVSDLTQKEYEFATNFKSTVVVREPQAFRDDTVESIIVDNYVYTFSFTDTAGLGTVRVYGLDSNDESARYVWSCKCEDGSAGSDVNCYDSQLGVVVGGNLCPGAPPVLMCPQRACPDVR